MKIKTLVLIITGTLIGFNTIPTASAANNKWEVVYNQDGSASPQIKGEERPFIRLKKNGILSIVNSDSCPKDNGFTAEGGSVMTVNGQTIRFNDYCNYGSAYFFPASTAAKDFINSQLKHANEVVVETRTSNGIAINTFNAKGYQAALKQANAINRSQQNAL